MKTAVLIASGIVLATLAAVSAPAQAKTMKECAAQWKEMKEANQTAGMKYRDFSKQCMSEGGAAAPEAKPAPTPAASSRKSPATADEACRDDAATGHDDNDRDQTDVTRPRGDDRPRARLRRRMEGRQGRRKDPGRHEVAAILERLRQAQEGGRDVTASRAGSLSQSSQTSAPRLPGFGAFSLRERRLVGGAGIEPATPSMSRKCSPAELTARSSARM